jgi:Helicase conserved C-terminal domain/SNF2-related domain
MMTVTSVEGELKAALQALFDNSTTQEKLLSQRDYQSNFLRDLLTKNNYTPRQITALHRAVSAYEEQLKHIGITLPTLQEIERHIVASGASLAQTIARPVVDIKNDFIEIRIPSKQYLPIIHKIRDDYKEAVRLYDAKYCGNFGKNSDTARCQFISSGSYWRLPYTVATLGIVTAPGNFTETCADYTTPAQTAMETVRAAEIAKRMEVEAVNAAQERAVQELYSLVPEEFAPGMRLYDHQISGIKFALSRERAGIFDQAGLGKTLIGLMTAYALQQKHGYRIYVITTVSNINDWTRIAETVGAEIEVFSWAKIPRVDNEYPRHPFVVLADESHRMGALTSAWTRRMLALAWHPNCKHFYPLTGTPIKNGRAINLLGLLLALKHPLVYVPFNVNYPIQWGKRYDKSSDETAGSEIPAVIKRKIREYEERYCDAKARHIGGRRIWENKGATNKQELHLLTTWKDGAQNHKDACMIQRKKSDHLNLPPKKRILRQVEVSLEATKTFQSAVTVMTETFYTKCEERMREFFDTYPLVHDGELPTEKEIEQKRYSVRQAEAAVLRNVYKHAAALAKIEYSVETTLELLDQDDKVVIFTTYVDVAKEIGKRIAEATGQSKLVGYILGEVKAQDRYDLKDDFQNPCGSCRVLISTAAGGESITLTASSNMIINDRPWTFGETDQWESRCYRNTQTETVIILWPQLPETITRSDIEIDTMINAKEVNSNEMRYGVAEGIEFSENIDINRRGLELILETGKKYSKKQ